MIKDYIQVVPGLPDFETLDQLLEFNLRFARRYLREEKSLSLMFVGFAPDARVIALVPPTHDKDRLAELVRSLFAQHKVVRYSVMSEAWISRKHLDVPPSQAPDREEVLLVTVGDVKHDLVALCRMHRDAKGRLLRIEAPQRLGSGSGEQQEGRFTRLLAPEGPTGETIERDARQLAQRYGLAARRFLH